jgi:glycosyltransferase involved in cell wall biosynthesis
MTTRPGLRICLIASSRFPIREPFAGGLEAHTHALSGELVRRGHRVSLFAAPGSDPKLGADELDVATFASSDAARADVASSPESWMREHHAYLRLMLDLARSGAHQFDVVHNNSLHHLPVAMAEALEVPLVTTLHTPPVPWLESAARLAPSSTRFVAVSDQMSRAWRHVVRSTTVHNGVDTELWRLGPGGGQAVWAGRMVPEKAPHAAIDAARAAGVALQLAGPAYDAAYFADEIAPRLGDDVRWLGHLSQRELSTVVGRADVALVTPSWEEPYGLVAAEAMSCGTPVAAFDRGAMRELVDVHTGRLAPADDVAALGRAIRAAAALPRGQVRATAVARWSLRRMVDEYESLYREVGERGDAA